MPRSKGIKRRKGPKLAPVDKIGPGAMRGKSQTERVGIRQRRRQMLRNAKSSKQGMES